MTKKALMQKPKIRTEKLNIFVADFLSGLLPHQIQRPNKMARQRLLVPQP